MSLGIISRILLHYSVILSNGIAHVQSLAGIHIDDLIAFIRLPSKSELLSLGTVTGIQLNDGGICSTSTRNINARRNFGTNINVIITIRNGNCSHFAYINGRL